MNTQELIDRLNASGLSSPDLTSSVHTAGRVTQLVSREYATMLHAFSDMMEKLEKAANTLNPQDQARKILEDAMDEFEAAKNHLVKEYKSLGAVDI